MTMQKSVLISIILQRNKLSAIGYRLSATKNADLELSVPNRHFYLDIVNS